MRTWSGVVVPGGVSLCARDSSASGLGWVVVVLVGISSVVMAAAGELCA